MSNFKNNFTKRIAMFIFLPLMLNLFYIQQLNINMAYFIVLIQGVIFISCLDQIKIGLDKGKGLILMLFFLLFIIAIFSSLFSDFQMKSLKVTFLVFTTSMLLVILTLSDKDPYKTYIKIVKINAIIGIVFSILAITLFVFGQVTIISGRTVQSIMVGPIGIYQVIMGMFPYYRVASLTTNPNTLGIILMLSQISTLYLFKVKLMPKKRFLVFYGIQIIGLMLTQSRGAIVTAFIMFIVFSLLSSKNQMNRIKIYSFSTILIFIMFYIITNEYFDIFSRFLSGLSNRDSPWNALIIQIYKNPLIGLGFGVSSEAVLYNLEIKAHNIFLNSISEIGIIGFMIFICIWIIGIIYSFIGVNKNKNNQEIKSAYALIFSILFALIFHQMIENKLLVYDYVMFLWVYLISLSTLRLNIVNKQI